MVLWWDRVVIVTMFVSQRRMFGSVISHFCCMSQMFHCIQHHKSDLRAYKCVTVQSALTAVLGSSESTAKKGQISEWWDDFGNFLLLEIYLNLISVYEQHRLHNQWAKVAMVCVAYMVSDCFIWVLKIWWSQYLGAKIRKLKISTPSMDVTQLSVGKSYDDTCSFVLLCISRLL